jgi:hypothetical protein
LIKDALNKTADHRFVLRCCHGFLVFSANFLSSVKRVVGWAELPYQTPLALQI